MERCSGGDDSGGLEWLNTWKEKDACSRTKVGENA